MTRDCAAALRASMANTTELWTRFLDGCLERRVREEQFNPLVMKLHRRSPIIGLKLADILISRQRLMPGIVDPLLTDYAESLLDHGRISSADLLGALYKHSRASAKPESQENQSSEKGGKPAYNPAELESAILNILMRAYLPDGKRPASQDETRIALRVLAEWLNTIASQGTALMQEVDHQIIVEALSVFDSIGALSIAMLENPKVIGIVDTALHKG